MTVDCPDALNRVEYLAITDLETSSVRPGDREILEIGAIGMAVLMDMAGYVKEFSFIESWSVRVKPKHIETADPESLKVMGYYSRAWADAMPLEHALFCYVTKFRGMRFCAYNGSRFDYPILKLELERAGFKNGLCPENDQLDLYNMARNFFIPWPKGLVDFKLKDVISFCGFEPEPDPHRAINGANSDLNLLLSLCRGTQPVLDYCRTHDKPLMRIPERGEK